MSMFLYEPTPETHPTFAGGIGTLADIGIAAERQIRYVDNSNAAHAALAEAYDRRIAAVKEATGQTLENPLEAADAEWRSSQLAHPSWPGSFSMPDFRNGPDSLEAIRRKHQQAFDGEIFALGEKFPLARQSIEGRPIEYDATEIARAADERLATLLASRPGAGKWAALLAGGLAGSLRDPVNVLSLAVGGGPGAARTVGGRILATAAKEALVNGATDAAMEPAVQAWREKAGLPHGFGEAMRNVLIAAMFGGALGGAGQAAAEALRPLARSTDIDAAAAAIEPHLTEPVRATLTGDARAATETLAPIRGALAPEARGALDEQDRMRLADESRPQSASPEHHDLMTARAEEAMQRGDIPRFEPDPEQVDRVVSAIAGKPEKAAPAERSLVQFLGDHGGVLDQQGELSAIGAQGLARKRRGKEDRRLPLDYAREAAAEAGYFDHLYGTPDEATARSTIADLLGAIDAEKRGQPVYAHGDGASPARSFDAERAAVERVVAEVAGHAGPAVDDAIIERAARLSIDENMDPGDALERVHVGDELAGAPAEAAEETPLERVGIDDPGQAEDELLAGPADFKSMEEEGIDIPFFEDDVKGEALAETLGESETLLAVAKACRA